MPAADRGVEEILRCFACGQGPAISGGGDVPEGAPDRRQVWNLLVMRKFVIVAVMFWLALAYQNSHRDFGGAKIEAVR